MEFQKTEDNIYYIHTYYPVRYEEHKGVSEELLRFKNGNQSSITRFSADLIIALFDLTKGNVSMLKGVPLALVPSHSANHWSSSLENVADTLCSQFGMANYSKAIMRVKDHEKLAYGGDRSIDSHMKTLSIDTNFPLQGKTIFVMDDITTTGHSLRACADVLYNAGAIKVIAIAIAKTF